MDCTISWIVLLADARLQNNRTAVSMISCMRRAFLRSRRPSVSLPPAQLPFDWVRSGFVARRLRVADGRPAAGLILAIFGRPITDCSPRRMNERAHAARGVYIVRVTLT